MPADVLRDLERLRYEYLLAQGRARREATTAAGGDPNQPAGMGLTLTHAPEAPAGPPGEDTLARLMQDYLMDRQAARLGPLEPPGAPALGPTLPGYGPPPAGPPRPAPAPTMPLAQPGLPDLVGEMPDPTAGRATQTLGDALAPPKPVPQAYVSPAEAQLHQGIVAGGMPLPMTREHAQAMADRGYPVETVDPTLGEALGATGRAAGFATFGRGGVGAPPDIKDWVVTQIGRGAKAKQFLTRDVGEIVGSLAAKLKQSVGGQQILQSRRIEVPPETKIIDPGTLITPGQEGPRILLGDPLYEQTVRAAGGKVTPRDPAAHQREIARTTKRMRGPEEITPYPAQPAMRTQLGRELGIDPNSVGRLRDPAFRASLAAKLGVNLEDIPDLTSSISKEYKLGEKVGDWYVGAYPMLQKIVQLIKGVAPREALVDVERDPALLAKFIAATSPRERPFRNVENAFKAYQRYLRAGRPDLIEDFEGNVDALHNFRTALRMRSSQGGPLMVGHAANIERAILGKPFETQKIANFLLDILGSEHDPTIDRWAANALLKKQKTTSNISQTEYQLAAAMMQELARIFNTTPVRFQAALWTGSKALRDPAMRELLLKGVDIDQAVRPLRSVIEMQGTKFSAQIAEKFVNVSPAVLAGLMLLDQAQGLEREMGSAPPEQ